MQIRNSILRDGLHLDQSESISICWKLYSSYSDDVMMIKEARFHMNITFF